MNYRAIYDRLMARAQDRVLTGYVERHHVVPRCLKGSDDASNIVRLTPEEHYVAHQLLVKTHPGHEGLAFAALRMSAAAPNGKAFGWLRRRAALARRGKKQSPNHVAKRAAAAVGKRRGPHAPATIAKLRARALARPKRTLSAEHRLKIAAAHRGRVVSLETRARLAASRTGLKQGPHSPEHRAKISAAHKKLGTKPPGRLVSAT